jgi:hypothetical protein
MAHNLKPGIDQQWLNESATSRCRLEMRPYYLKEICQIYGMSYKAMRKKINPIRDLLGDRSGYYFSVRQLEVIVRHLGPPYVLVEND